MLFHILWDAESALCWLLAKMATDSMSHPDPLPADRYNLPNNEHHLLGLCFSKNCMEGCFAGIVARGEVPQQARHYASMVIDEERACWSYRDREVPASRVHAVAGFRHLAYV